MKRLLEEPTDEVTRLLIRAGANHQPPQNGKFRLIASLGLGSALGLFAREAVAWLGSGGGKVALAVTVIGASAGGVYSLTHTPLAEPSRPARSAPALVLGASPEARPAPSTPMPDPGGDARPEVASSEPKAPSRSRARREPAAEEAAQTADPPQRETLSLRRLTEETLWVDQLRVAAERGDRASFQRLQQGYAAQFPDGQLRPEVDRLRDAL